MTLPHLEKQSTTMDEQEVLAKALAFEYYTAIVLLDTTMGEPSAEEAMKFYEDHKTIYIGKSQKLLALLSDSYANIH
jgi:hypothetical protein